MMNQVHQSFIVNAFKQNFFNKKINFDRTYSYSFFFRLFLRARVALYQHVFFFLFKKNILYIIILFSLVSCRAKQKIQKKKEEDVSIQFTKFRIIF
jgi:hypothetical protein